MLSKYKSTGSSLKSVKQPPPKRRKTARLFASIINPALVNQARSGSHAAAERVAADRSTTWFLPAILNFLARGLPRAGIRHIEILRYRTGSTIDMQLFIDAADVGLDGSHA